MFPQKSSFFRSVFNICPFREVAIFGNELTDHCVIAIKRQAKPAKDKHLIIFKQHNQFCRNWVYLLNDLELAQIFFYDASNWIVIKHAPFHKFYVKGWNNPRFISLLTNFVKKKGWRLKKLDDLNWKQIGCHWENC